MDKVEKGKELIQTLAEIQIECADELDIIKRRRWTYHGSGILPEQVEAAKRKIQHYLDLFEEKLKDFNELNLE